MAAAELPQEIIGNILIRLPVKSLVRFRCVCKLWRSLINDSYFIRKHVNRITNLYNTKMEDEYESPIVSIHSTTSLDGATINTTIFKFLDTDKKEGKFEDNSIHNEPIMLSFRDIDFPEQLKPCYAFIRGSCDGILCVVTSDCVLLWNPSIREYKILHPSCPNKYFGVDVDVYGIGYDASVDDYKVLRAPSIFSTRSSVEVLALKSNSWKIIQNNFPYKLICLYHSIFANGGIHWVAKRALTQKEVILCFNVVSEKFNEVPLPPSTDLNFRYSTLLRLFRGNLCVFQYHPLLKFNGGSYLDVWVMKEYGVGESWSKLFTVPQLRGHDNWCEPLEPFCLTRSGIILVCSTRFVLYNWQDGTFKKLSIDPTGLFNGNFMYVESLVSPIGSNKI